MSDSRPVALVTGASSGVGRATASLLAARGYRVFGTSRNPSGEATSGVEMLPLDVRDDASVAACVAAVTTRAGRLDLLVNNAGFEQAGALEELSLEEARAQFETNFFGVVRMVKEVLPIMRRQRSGRIINVSSLAGLAPIPFMGIYSASKFAIDGYTEALRLEVSPLGILVSQVEPGFLKTPMMGNRKVSARTIADYDAARERAFAAIRASEEKGPGAEAVAETIVRIAGSVRPRLRYLVGGQARFVTALKRFAPEAAYERGVRSTFRLDRKS
jgi:NAD(P)-dependent dehydrogenase (short-subunit alcohol dehydrogenase family)